MKAVSKYPLQRLKFVATINDETLTEDVDPDYEIQYIDIGNVDSSGTIHEIATYRFKEAPSRARRVVRDGDVIISTVRTYLQAIAPITSPSDNLIVSTGFAVIRPRSGAFDAKFCRYVLCEPLFLAEVEMRSTGISYPAINASEIGNIPISYPPMSDQQVIADIIETEFNHIDSLISAKQRLLDLLAEKRSAIVAEAIMRGLNPASPMRSSGVDWLGDIPEHWDVIPLRFLVSFSGGATPDTRNLEYWNGTIPWVSPKDMKRDLIDDAEDHVSEEGIANSALKMIEPGAILIVVRGMILAHSFPAAINTVPVTINQDMKALLCAEKIASAFLLGVLNGAKSYLVSLADSSAHGTRKLETEALGRFDVPVPPLAEQQEIVRHIATETAKIDRLRAATEHSVTLLKERRGALIAAAVTGRIDIPEML